jgi:hypothetical protein
MLFKEIQADASWNLVKRSDVIDGGDVEAAESIRMKVLAHENGELVKAVFQNVHGISSSCEDIGIIPNLRVKLFFCRPFSEWLKEFHVIVSLFINVDSNYACASGKLRGSIVHKRSLI